MRLDLAFLWHMHQPDYRDASGVMQMPWVFLHAIKDYHEMPWLLSRTRGLKATFNLTPPLLTQLRLYLEKGASADRFLSLLTREPQWWSDGERAFVEKICRSVRVETMGATLPRLKELYGQSELDEAERTELSTLFLLAWCGNYLRQTHPLVRAYIQKGRGFGHEELQRLIAALLDFLPEIFAIYRTLHEQGRIALSTTPLDHPILPLLLDMNNAKISNPATAIPPNHFPLIEDARLQVERAMALFEEIFGFAPTGFWPAEGAVDEKSVALYRDKGLRWIATDEAILFKSLGSDVRAPLYRPQGFGGLFIAFRDHELSDLIGFTYRQMAPERAAEDFMGRLETIAREHRDATVSVILDGENAWEFYSDNAMPFFEALYGAIEGAPWCETATMEELSLKARSGLPRLHPGSWIYGTFDTWVGHREKNAAWELLFMTKRDYLHHEKDLDEGVRARITEHFLAAECSDWFWWLGDDHHTDFSGEFDTLFRAHLITVYRLLGLTPPANLFKPIPGDRKDLHALFNAPKAPIHPVIDGRVTSFFEWLGSGVVDERIAFSTMDGAKGPVEKLRWGMDARRLYLRLDGDMERLKGATLQIFAQGDGVDAAITIDLAHPPKSGDVVAAADRVVEVAIDKAAHFAGAERVRLHIEILEEGRVVQLLPGAAELSVDLQECYDANWFV
ncbi:glycoside hydrolase family 57 protein [Hydrogenimonas sp.]